MKECGVASVFLRKLMIILIAECEIGYSLNNYIL